MLPEFNFSLNFFGVRCEKKSLATRSRGMTGNPLYFAISKNAVDGLITGNRHQFVERPINFERPIDGGIMKR